MFGRHLGCLQGILAICKVSQFTCSLSPDVVGPCLGKSMRYLDINGLKPSKLRASSFPAGVGWGTLENPQWNFHSFLQLSQLLDLQFNNNGRLRLSTAPSRLVCITILVHMIILIASQPAQAGRASIEDCHPASSLPLSSFTARTHNTREAYPRAGPRCPQADHQAR